MLFGEGCGCGCEINPCPYYENLPDVWILSCSGVSLIEECCCSPESLGACGSMNNTHRLINARSFNSDIGCDCKSGGGCGTTPLEIEEDWFYPDGSDFPNPNTFDVCHICAYGACDWVSQYIKFCECSGADMEDMAGGDFNCGGPGGGSCPYDCCPGWRLSVRDAVPILYGMSEEGCPALLGCNIFAEVTYDMSDPFDPEGSNTFNLVSVHPNSNCENWPSTITINPE